ncbi:MAG: cellulase family glycosylhydrolase [Deferribacteres bacterium]|nr:cellulase family glycosylhydrolase [candidate division KSB1 bacterium]MCB9501875.1 cellulase family glycosylhydrolase [Deferribacteres bacterium]
MFKKLLFGILVGAHILFAQELPFTRGVNISGWFQEDDVHQIQFARITKKDFINLKTMGCDVIRLPINLHFMTDGAPNYTVDPLFFTLLDQVVDWSEELEMHLILDNHTFDPSIDTEPTIATPLLAIWPQMAAHYKNRSRFIYYEVLNEPHGISNDIWNTIQKSVINAIRAIDTTHTIVVGPADWNSYSSLEQLPVYNDDNLIYTFHFYDPFLFTHQGASWVEPSMVGVAGVPFPYDAGRMPEMPASLQGSWIHDLFNRYDSEGNADFIRQKLDIAVAFKEQRNVPLLCGEFGVLMNNAEKSDRAAWHKIVVDYLQEKGIAWTLWEFNSGFGIFEPGSAGLWEQDLNVPLIEALGLQPIPQGEVEVKPDQSGFNIYEDFPGENIYTGGFNSGGEYDYYWQNNTYQGDYCVYWTEANQYNSLVFDFKPDKDLSLLQNTGYVLTLAIRGDMPGQKLDFRFLDSKTDDPEDHPWRVNFTIDEKVVPWNGQWYEVHIPLSSFRDGGSWDDAWFNPIPGIFDWTAVDRFEIVAEHGGLGNAQFWFDAIGIVDPNASQVAVTESPDTYRLSQNYPNPFSPNGIRKGYEAETAIEFFLPRTAFVSIAIFNVGGQRVCTLLAAEKQAGKHTVTWDGRSASGVPVASGDYYYKLWTQDFSAGRMMSLVN